MKKFLPILIAVLLVFLSAVPGSLAETAAEPTPAPTEEPTFTPEPTPSPTPEPLPPFPESPLNIHVKEEDGGEFRPLPLDIEQGGAKLVQFKYTTDISVYEDPTIRAEYHRVKSNDWGVVFYYTDIIIKDPSQMRTAFATRTNRFNANYKMPVRAIASKLNPVIAINGDFFAGFSGKAYVLRQGDVYRGDTCEPNFDMLLVDEDGDFHVLTADQDLASIDKTQVDGKKVINAFQFGPALVIDGRPVADEILNDRSRSPRDAQPDMANQRMGIMQIDKLHYMVLTCAHYGLTLPKFRDLAMYVSNYQAKTVFTLDGGNSSQMVFLGRKRNSTDSNPETNKDKEGERPVTDIIYWASAWFTR